MIEAIWHADKEMEWFRKIEPKLPDEVLGAIRLELITAFRAGYELAVKNDFEMTRVPRDFGVMGLGKTLSKKQ